MFREGLQRFDNHHQRYKKQPCFSKMYLYMTEKMHKAIEELPQEQRDLILSQVANYIASYIYS